MQRDLIVVLKKETSLNLGIISKLQTMPPDLSRLMFKESALEKPTQNLFNHLSYYLINIIDCQASTSLSWPLYDTKLERAYRIEVSGFISDYSSKGLLSPVMSSYLVNPGCYKVTLLIFQLSQLAVQALIKSKMKEKQSKLYDSMTEKYKSEDSNVFIEDVEKERQITMSKFSNYLYKQRSLKKIAQMFRDQISKMESTLASTQAQKYLDNIIDGFISKHPLDNTTKMRLHEIKYVNKPPQFLQSWLSETDKKIEDMESKWAEKVSPFLQLCNDTQYLAESLIARHTREVDKDTYSIEYNHQTDYLCTKDLQNQVSSQQKYVLRNIIKDEKLIFPNLIRGFVIAISFILKNVEVNDDVYKFNKCLEGGRRKYSDTVKAMRELIHRVNNAEAKLQSTPVNPHYSLSIGDLPEIPPLPDLSSLLCSREMQCQALLNSFTPLMYKHQFNLQRKNKLHTLKPQPRMLFLTPFCKEAKDDILKSLKSSRMSMYRPDTEKCQNLSVVSDENYNRANETIAGHSSGFTRQQIMRLLSTKKSGLRKKMKPCNDKSRINKEALFDNSNSPIEGNGLFRSYSSPNLLEDNKPRNTRRRKLSIMQEASPTALELSGIATLDKDCSNDTVYMMNPEKLSDTSSLPNIASPCNQDRKFHNMIKDFEINLNREITADECSKKPAVPKVVTPKNNVSLRKPNSLEKIINRFKMVRANVVKSNDCVTIVEDKYLSSRDHSNKFNNIKDVEVNFSKELMSDDSFMKEGSNQNTIITPKNNAQLQQRSNSLEKIINRYKKVRCTYNVIPETEKASDNITNKKENEEKIKSNIEVYNAKRILLPDLLSPSCSVLNKESTDYLNELCEDMDDNICRKPRESLGTALGVDHTILDQFDLID